MKLIDIAFDMDGVLVDIIPAVSAILREKHNAKLLPIKEWRLFTEPEVPDPEIWECIHEAYGRFELHRIYSGAKEVLHRLWKLSDNDPVKIITARPPKRAAGVTYRFVSEMLADFPYELVIVSDNDKLPYLNRYKYYVEDRRANAIHYANAGKKVFLVDRSYNKMDEPHPNIRRIRGVYDLLPHCEKFIKEI